jgi:hypothetical protein
VQAKKSSTPKRTSSADETPKAVAAPAKRVFGSAKGQITFKKGWDAPMTKRELDEFIGRSSYGKHPTTLSISSAVM